MSLPYLGATTLWDDDGEVTLSHVKREVADKLRRNLEARLSMLNQVELDMDSLVVELRSQMAECAVRGDLAHATELSDIIWDLISWRDEARLS